MRFGYVRMRLWSGAGQSGSESFTSSTSRQPQRGLGRSGSSSGGDVLRPVRRPTELQPPTRNPPRPLRCSLPPLQSRSALRRISSLSSFPGSAGGFGQAFVRASERVRSGLAGVWWAHSDSVWSFARFLGHQRSGLSTPSSLPGLSRVWVRGLSGYMGGFGCGVGFG